MKVLCWVKNKVILLRVTWETVNGGGKKQGERKKQARDKGREGMKSVPFGINHMILQLIMVFQCTHTQSIGEHYSETDE